MTARIEVRGIRCLECTKLDLQTNKEQAKGGFGLCTAAIDLRFVSAPMARNCIDFDPAPPDVVKPRNDWAERLPIFPKKQDNN